MGDRMSAISKGLTVLVVLGATAQAGGALAQSASSSLNSAQAQTGNMFARDRSVAVRDRPHPEYEAFGLPVGTFTAYPKVEVGAEYNDNIFAVSTGEDDDVIIRVKPEVSLISGWSRHAVSAYARAAFNEYQDFDDESTTDWGVGANGRLDVTRATNVIAGIDYASLTEPRTSSNTPTATAEPIQYDMTSAYVAGSRTSNRLKLSARGDWRSFDYEDGETLGGIVIDQDNRDRDLYSVTGRADYAISPATALFIQATGNEREYDIASTTLFPNRDSSGYEVLAGANFELGALARGEVAAGYISQEFDQDVYGKVDGFGARALIEWFPTQLTTVTATGSRTVEDSAIIGSGGYLSTAVGLQIDHEVLRNVIVGGALSYSEDDYEGIDRNDDRFMGSVSATYLVNRRLGVSLAATHMEQNSKGANNGSDFDVNKLMISFVGQF